MNERAAPPAAEREPGSAVVRLVERLRGLVRRGGDPTLSEAIQEIIEEGEGSDARIGAQEQVLIRNVLKLRDRTAYDVMVPRADIVAIRHDIPLADLVKLFQQEAHSRLPVYRETLDDAVGMIHIKDVFRFWGASEGFLLGDIVRPVLFIAPSMRLLDLLLEMRKSRTHMALVVDEYGGIDGLATIEDVVEAIVGDIEDEHDVATGPLLAELPDGSFVAEARLPVAEFEARLGPVMPPGEQQADIDTIGGVVVALAGRVPGRGEVIQHPGGFEFEILDADPRRVKRVKLRKKQPPEAAPAGPPK